MNASRLWGRMPGARDGLLVALQLAFSTVNDALGAIPDAELASWQAVVDR